ncbi:MAG: hypothetical protein COW30_08535 [Rhodospirillales bacterium CG15_BIG_FIL_POST_REV_8_21_14_020_66_15]|nr:MAG: hypothetical protein COW30_08535 [Rhodospirillales bacterium CG15_BIG_FIL_POST_REV_8_21_14_020_66_15]
MNFRFPVANLICLAGIAAIASAVPYVDAEAASEKAKAGPAATEKPGSRPLVPGRTLFIVSTDGSPPAKVNGQEITWDAYNAVLGRAAQTKFYHGKAPEGGEEALRTETIEALIMERLLTAEAKKRGLTSDQEWVKGEIDKLELRYKGSAMWQNQRATAIPKIRKELEKQSLLKRLEHQARVVEHPTQAQLRAFFEENPTLFTEPAKEKISVILLGVDPSSHHSVWEKAREEAGRILAKIKAGTDFAEIANLRSTDTSAEQGGDLGYVHRGMLSGEAQKVVDNLKPGEVSEPVRILQGYAIFKLFERSNPRELTFEEAADRVNPLYVRITADKQWLALQKHLRESASVTVNPILAGN